MLVDQPAEILRLRATLRDLVALSTIPAAWVGREPSAIATGLADVLLGLLDVRFAFVRLCHPTGCPAVEVMRGDAWKGFPEWLQHLSVGGEFSRKEIISEGDGGAESCRVIVVPIGVNAEGGLLAAARDGTDFPDEVDRLLLSVAANNAATAFQNARLINELRSAQKSLEKARSELEIKVAERTSELRHSEAYLAEAQRLSHTGSFGWDVSSGELYCSEETFRILEWDRAIKPSMELILQRTYPEDRALVQQTIDRVTQERKDFDLEHRLLMTDGSVKYVQVVAHALAREESGNLEFVGAVRDITEGKRAEQTLRQSEERLRLLLESAKDYAIITLDLNGQVASWNAGAERIKGYKAAEIIGQHFSCFYPIEDVRQGKPERELEIVRAEERIEDEGWRVRKDGSRLWANVIISAMRDQQGRLMGYSKITRDLTERKREEALRDGESHILEMIARDAPLEEILENLVLLIEAEFEGLLCSVLLLDEDGQHIRHGAAPSLPESYTKAIDGLCIGPVAGSCGTAMYRREPVIVTDILQDPLWEDYRSVAAPYGLRACWSTPILAHSCKVLGSFAMYYREPRSPGPAETRVLGMATHLAGIAIARKRAQEALQESESYLEDAQRLSHTGSWAWKVATREVIHWSEECFRLYGFDRKQGLPSWEEWSQRVHPEDRDKRHETVDRAIRQRADYKVDYRIVLPDGTIRHIHSVAHPVFNASGDLVEFVETSMDVTERKRAEEERERLRQAQADLAHISRVTTIGELTGALAHEIRQPIAAAITDANTCLRWLRRDHPDLEEACEAASRMVKDVTRAAEIINRIRLLSKKGVPERELVDVNEVIQEMMVLLRHEATRYSISIRSDLAEKLPKSMADRVQLQQVLMNLMLNGIEAMKDVSPAGVLTIKSEREEDGRLLISVSDTGVGLPPDRADQIFNAFFTTKSQGTGMGLTISRSIIESHGGRLWVTADSGQGATFRFTLPSEVAAHA
jgi:PAS domain S-box-containing protein